MRICKRCSRTEQEVTFPKDSGYADGVSRYCSDCKNAYKRGEWKPVATPRVCRVEERRCVKCDCTPNDIPFLPNKHNLDGLDNICVDCARVRDAEYMQRYYKKYPNEIRERVRKREYRMAEAWVEAVDDYAVFERDGWICQLCKQPVDSSLVRPDPYSPSLDHIVPIARGGTHEYANVQLAHLVCNMRKGARVSPEVE